MPAWAAVTVRALGAAALGAVSAAAYAILSGLAFNGLRSWEMGAIPFLLAAFVFVGLLAGIVAGLGWRARPYLAAVLAMVLLFVLGDQIGDRREALTPLLTADERREFWANIQGFLFAGGPFGVGFALWGALIVDPRPRWRWLRDGSYAFAGWLAFVALVPAAIHWLPWPIGFAGAAAAAIAFTVWIARRNSQNDAILQGVDHGR